jgi:UDP:flavonoid glycosyltransferase YjiC (YdhE family)
MKVLLAPAGSHGDVHPFVGIGLEMRARGHDVVIATNAHFRELIERAGMRFVEVGTKQEYEEAIANPDLWNARKATQFVASMTTRMLERGYTTLEREYDPGKTLIVAGSLAFAARVAQEVYSAPMVTIHLQPSMLRSVYATPMLGNIDVNGLPRWLKRPLFWLADVAVIDRVFGGPINQFRKRFGLKPAKRIMADWWHSPLLTIGMFPEWYAPPQPDWPRQVRLTGFPLYDERGVTEEDPVLTEFLKSGDSPIAFTPGTAMIHGRAWLQAAAGACEILGRRGLLLTRFAEQIPERLPAGVIHRAFAPFSQLLPQCAAFVHHGGIGSTAQGLAAGIPQLIKPMAHDQHDNAMRVKRLGVGGEMRTGHEDARATADALTRVMTRETERNCTAIAARFSQEDGIKTTCTLLEEVGFERG